MACGLRPGGWRAGGLTARAGLAGGHAVWGTECRCTCSSPWSPPPSLGCPGCSRRLADASTGVILLEIHTADSGHRRDVWGVQGQRAAGDIIIHGVKLKQGRRGGDVHGVQWDCAREAASVLLGNAVNVHGVYMS